MSRFTLLAALAAALIVSGAAATPRPTSYTLPGNAVFPEGVAFQQETGNFFVGSTTDGTVFRGHVSQPSAGAFLAPGADGRTSVTGIKVDDQGRLYVAGAGTGLVFVYDSATGALIRRFTTGFSGAQFLNDIAIAANGDAFVTDSLRPVLYRVPAADVVSGAGTGNLDVWLDFTGTPIVYAAGFNLNGIVATPDGAYLVVVQSNTGQLFRISLATKQVVQIDLGDESVAGDGLALQGRTLYAVARPDIAKIRLAEDLASGEVLSRTFDPSLAFPTTIAIARGRLLVVNSQFDKRGGTPVLPFTVSSIELP
jgi:DNA-binding beta-propeller fold protein YncE